MTEMLGWAEADEKALHAECAEAVRAAVEKYIDGTIGGDLLAQLKTHAETCESCREELGRCALMQDVLGYPAILPFQAAVDFTGGLRSPHDLAQREGKGLEQYFQRVFHVDEESA